MTIKDHLLALGIGSILLGAFAYVLVYHPAGLVLATMALAALFLAWVIGIGALTVIYDRYTKDGSSRLWTDHNNDK